MLRKICGISFITLIFVLFASALAFAAPLTNADVKPILDRVIPNAAKVDRIWRYNPKFDKTSDAKPDDDGNRYIRVGKSFPYKSVKQIMALTGSYYSKWAIKNSFTFQTDPAKFKDMNGALYAWTPDSDGDPRAYKWIRKGAVIVRQSADTLVLKCRSQEQSSGKIGTAYLFLAKEGGVWKLDQDIDVAYRSPDRLDR